MSTAACSIAFHAELNGSAPTADQLALAAVVNYGHFTVMQIRQHGLRGCSLHLERLDNATRELFGWELSGERVRGYIRHILQGTDGSASVRVNVFSRDMWPNHMEAKGQPEVLVTINVPRANVLTPFRVHSVKYQRDPAHIKHVGTFALFHYQRQARFNGYDDALFVDNDSAISEGTIWNVGFYDGQRVVFPASPALPGITQMLIEAGLRERRIPVEYRNLRLADLTELRSAFAMNTGAIGRPIASIDGMAFTIDDELTRTLVACHDSNPLEPV